MMNNQNPYALQTQPPRQITFGGMVPITSIEDVLKYPVEPGVCIHFKDTTDDYIYTKTQGFSQMEKPVYEAYKLQKVNFEELLPENKKLAKFVTMDQMNEMVSAMSMLTKEVAALKQSIGGDNNEWSRNYNKTKHKQRREEHEQTTKFRPGAEMREN